MSRTHHLVAGATLLLACLVARPATAADEPEPFKRLSIRKVEKLLGRPGVHIYDGNSSDAYRKAHVPGAVNLYSGDIKEGVLPAAKDAILVFYCMNTL